MKTKWCLLVFLMAATFARAQTNLTALLQQGLFEEQANRNLDAAISNYQSLATQFDKNRLIAATAIFRLGECYRMQNKTNEAAAEYQRIINEFSDQTTLVTLSRQDLAGMGATISKTDSFENSDAALWDKIKNLSQAELENVLPTLVSDAELTTLLQQRDDAKTKLAALQSDYGLTSPEIVKQKAVLDAIEKQISDAIDGIKQALQLRAEISQPHFQERLQTIVANAPQDVNAVRDEERQEIQRIQTMIQNSPDLINARSGEGSTPLEKAARDGWLKVAAFLLDHGADVNADGSSALYDATIAGNRGMVELLLSRGADINAKGSLGKTSLHMATEKNFQAVAEVLIANKADVNAIDNLGETPLDSAAEHGRTKIVQMLLAAGANPNVVDNNGQTALSFAAGSPEIVKILLDVKADPNGGTMDAPLLSAIHEKNIASAELLLQAGANPNLKGQVDWQIYIGNRVYGRNFGGLASLTPLWLAIDMKQFPMMQLLLKYKADPNDSQTDRTPVLFNALDDTNILAALLDAGGNANSRPPSGWWPLLDAAVWRTNVTTVQLLLEHGADVNIRNDNDQNGFGNYTPLHFAAAQLADPKIFELLFEYHADPSVRGDDGKTPLDLLKEKMGAISTANVNGFGVAMRTIDISPDQQKNQATAAQLADLLRQHGALDNLPDWNSVKVSRPSANFSETIFRKGTNDWNHFTLLEFISQIYYDANRNNIRFPDFAHIAVVRPNADGKAPKQIEINLLNSTNSVDCSKDMRLEFGDTVVIPERGHTLAEADTWTSEQMLRIVSFLMNEAGEIKLIVVGGQTVQLPLKDFEPENCSIGRVLQSLQAQNVLTSDSDLSRVKVTRRDSKTGKKNEWILDCAADQTAETPPNSFAARQRMLQNASQASPDLWLRDGDVIEVPKKQ